MGVIEILKRQERAEGRSEGLAEGRSEGLAEGKVLTKEEIIKNLILKFNYSDALIAQISLSPLTFVQQQRRRIEEGK